MSAGIVKSGNVEFEALEPSDLQDVSVVAQSLDNQWVPKKLLRKMLRRGLSHDIVRSEREKYVRTEYIRALVNAEQVIINRAYLYNNPVVSQDYLELGENRSAFKDLLESGVIIPYLLGEQTPIDEPRFRQDPQAFSAWQELSQEVSMKCVRLSWDDKFNGEFVRARLAGRFHEFALNTSSKEVDVFCRELELKSPYTRKFRERLTEIGQTCLQFANKGELATREELYKKFITFDGTSPEQGKFDKGKPFASEIKRLLDLSYNINLPDALGTHALTPSDSLPRTALQEWQDSRTEKEFTGEQIIDLFRRSAFSLIQGGLFLKSLGSLTIPDVQEVRRMDEWAEYIGSLRRLLKSPLSFSDPDAGAHAVYRSYIEMARKMTRLVAGRRELKRRRRWNEKWVPTIEFVVEVAGAILSVVWSEQGAIYNTVGNVSARVAQKGAPVVGRLIIRGATELGAQAELSTSVDIMRGRMEDAHKQWDDLVARVAQLDGFREINPIPRVGQDATINYPDDIRYD